MKPGRVTDTRRLSYRDRARLVWLSEWLEDCYVTPGVVAARFGWTTSGARNWLARMGREGLVEGEGFELRLTEAGRREARHE